MKLLTIRLWLSSAIASISCIFVIFLNESHIWDWEHSQNHPRLFISPATHLCIQLQYVAFAIPMSALALTLLLRKKRLFQLRLLPELLYVFACAWLLYAMFVWQVQLGGVYLRN